MRLMYIGPDPAVVGIVPLPEGWPAFDHDEADDSLAAEKVASGSYASAHPAKAEKPAEPPPAAAPESDAAQEPNQPAPRRSRRESEAEE